MKKKVIGHLVMWTPVIAILICAGFFTAWWVPLFGIAGGLVILGFALLGLRIMR